MPQKRSSLSRRQFFARSAVAAGATTVGGGLFDALVARAAFAGEPDAAHIAGDVAMLAPEVNPVIRALRASNIEVVAVHSHMLDEQPRILFLHYYGHGVATTLARGFRAALEQLGKPQPTMGGMKM